MRIQLSKDLNKTEISEKIKNAEIVDDGDFILISKHDKINVYDENGSVLIKISEIEYIEAYDNQIYVHTNNKRYESTLKLYEYLDLSDFLIRINKSTIINKYKIEEIRPSFNMKFKVLINNHWLDVNRTYYYDFKDAIGI